MDREKLQTFIMTAEGDLAFVRSSLLVVAQTGDASDLSGPRRTLARLSAEATANEVAAIADLCVTCEISLGQLTVTGNPMPRSVNEALDILTRIEAAVWRMSMSSDLTDIGGFVDASFDELMPDRVEAGPVWCDEDFDIDEETLDVFRTEADDLLTSIKNSLAVLSNSPGDQNALWEIRRNAHTFKGAAGIVGLKEASQVAHSMEDLLDKMVELRCDAAPKAHNFLNASAGRLIALVNGKDLDDAPTDLSELYTAAMNWLVSSVRTDRGLEPGTDDLPDPAVSPRADTIKTTTTPIVRVSLDRLDELIRVSQSLLINRAALAERLAEYQGKFTVDPDSFLKIESLFETQRTLTDEIQSKLMQIRMVRFGTLETRLSRAVNVTCLDEGKKAVVVIENGDVEIDTQVIDALIEPLLHLLKNAVVHGIETPDTRRMISKPERGTIRINLEADDEALIMSISDDGAGISVPKLKEKAVASRILSTDQAEQLTDRDAMQLIFDRGLTTTDTINLNAGRGVGMSIVKESIESHGGSVLITSEPHRGTTFTILMPLAVAKPKLVSPEPAEQFAEPASMLPPVVLVVDDSASIRRQTTKLVEAEGLRVITANNGAEALELLLSGDWEPDLILSDIEMPQIDGWAFLEYVKTDENFGHVPVVMVTSLDSGAHRERAFELGATDYLIKPLNERDLTEVLENLGKA